jgi:hypothetical protein
MYIAVDLRATGQTETNLNRLKIVRETNTSKNSWGTECHLSSDQVKHLV